MGPVFVKEPPNRVDFSNGTGAVVECQARGNPQPDIIWVRADGSAVGDVPGLRQVLPFLFKQITRILIFFLCVLCTIFQFHRERLTSHYRMLGHLRVMRLRYRCNERSYVSRSTIKKVELIVALLDRSFANEKIFLCQVLPNGNLVFPPFRAEDYRQEVHAQVYSCLARSPAGSVHSRDVNVRAGK